MTTKPKQAKASSTKAKTSSRKTTPAKPPAMDMATRRRVAGNSKPQQDDNEAVPLAEQMHVLALKFREASHEAIWKRLMDVIRTDAERGLLSMNREDVESLMEGADATARLHINQRLKDEGFEIVDGSISWQLAESQPKDVDQEGSHAC